MFIWLHRWWDLPWGLLFHLLTSMTTPFWVHFIGIARYDQCHWVPMTPHLCWLGMQFLPLHKCGKHREPRASLVYHPFPITSQSGPSLQRDLCLRQTEKSTRNSQRNPRVREPGRKLQENHLQWGWSPSPVTQRPRVATKHWTPRPVAWVPPVSASDQPP